MRFFGAMLKIEQFHVAFQFLLQSLLPLGLTVNTAIYRSSQSYKIWMTAGGGGGYTAAGEILSTASFPISSHTMEFVLHCSRCSFHERAHARINNSQSGVSTIIISKLLILRARNHRFTRADVSSR
jgi:hypothetical protein